METMKEPRGKPRGIFDRKEFYLILIRSLTPQQAVENALAIAVHGFSSSRYLCLLSISAMGMHLLPI